MIVVLNPQRNVETNNDKYNEAIGQFHYILKKINCLFGVNNVKTQKMFISHIDNIFLRDNYIKLRNGIIVSRMKNKSRTNEVAELKNNTDILNDAIYEIKSPGFMEGGDYLENKDTSFIGYGERTNLNAIKQIMKNNILQKDKLIIIRCTTSEPNEIHLDLLFNIVNDNTVLLSFKHKQAKCSYYKLENGVYTLISSNRSINELLEDLSYNIIYVSEESQKKLGCNILSYNNVVLSQDKQVSRDIAERGFKVEQLKMDKIIKYGGGIHCITNELI